MRAVKNTTPVYLYRGVTDMRCGIDGLSAKVVSELGVNLFTGALFVFLSKRRDKVKILYFDEDGFALWMKRLESGVFRVRRADEFETITAVQLEELLRGVELSRIQFREEVQRKSFV